ncbi:MAG: carboxylesterase family protein [Clostridia bacterium]|nr:carboxylesterase family protein [Clostridia bacterium]
MQTVSVKTPCGEVIGEKTEYGARFQGVRYAMAKRFEKPIEITHYDAPQDATKQGVCCYQMRAFWNEEHRFYFKEFRKGQTFEYSEDCQILNIFAPADAKDAPVIVFIHGGSFTGGSINETQFDCSAYAKRGIVAVTINYRLNVFGSFVDGVHSNGNLHLLDQVTAIEWVRHNISAFGGNPEQITLMGQSAGAISIQSLICTDVLKGKIKGAIMLSGGGKRTGLLPLSKPNKRYWAKLTRECGATTFEEAQAFPAEQIWTEWRTKHLFGKATETKVVVDGELVKDKKYLTDVPVIFGVVKKDLAPPVLNHMAQAFARKQARKGSPAYIFHLDRLLPPDEASFHSCDLWYALGSLDKSWRPFEEKDFAISNDMVDRFAAFAKTQNPNVSDEDWRTYHGKKDIKVWE